MPTPRDPMSVRCISCECSDSSQCSAHYPAAPFSWLRFDPLDARGVCSGCSEAVARWDAGDREFAAPVVALAWATRKRHIAIDGKLLCAPAFTSGIRQRGAGGYNSMTVGGVPSKPKELADDKGSHFDGVIAAAPLEAQPGIITSSICLACQTRFRRWLLAHPQLAPSDSR